MEFKVVAPPPILQPYVQYFWTLKSAHSDLPRSFGPLVDGNPGLMFQQVDKGAYTDQWGKQLPELFIYGQTITRTLLTFRGAFETMGVSFFPNTLQPVFGLNASELTDTCLDLNLLKLRNETQLTEVLVNTETPEDRIQVLANHLSTQVKKYNLNVDEPTHFALLQIIHSGGQVSLKNLHKDIKLSERSFERRFKAWVGITPKLYARVCQFQASLKQLRTNNFVQLSDIAFDNGFSDQSHFIRTFKEFTGFSPFRFRKQTSQVGHEFPLMIFPQNS